MAVAMKQLKRLDGKTVNSSMYGSSERIFLTIIPTI